MNIEIREMSGKVSSDTDLGKSIQDLYTTAFRPIIGDSDPTLDLEDLPPLLRTSVAYDGEKPVGFTR